MSKQLREAVELFEEVMIYGTERVLRAVDHPLWQEYSPEQLQMMGIIQKHGPVASNKLAAIQGVHKSAISNRLKKLAEQGLVQMVKAKEDQRTKLIELTENGKAVIEKYNGLCYSYIEQLLSDQIEEHEIEQFIKTLRKLKKILRLDGE
ncbi:MarR family winged helix-turn-helix transcriptional regulator [Bacillus xiapuensis]|uniref:MarR family winged helix-turn-helix transcriptional regulator n=1 Tax=Bacillus xiapuensis TaxID=2014075 RepID=UPI000C241F61|nr:MarR family winged helix-turn-helix transcriptional regulator [Bacillus xiapuensis]